ncbi:FTR1 family protein [Streptomyces sp. CAU 1734]|uniref:FTR1 family protein n=1 Tax=Streptomyces sp. CAU 1734 TaxID=3140360 RepID=UPI0032617656
MTTGAAVRHEYRYSVHRRRGATPARLVLSFFPDEEPRGDGNHMFGTYLFGLREGLGAAVALGLVIALLRRTGRPAAVPAVLLGAGAGVAVFAGLTCVLEFAPPGLTFRAQGLLTAALALPAAAALGGLVVWLRRDAAGGRREPGIPAPVPTGFLVVTGFLAAGRNGTEAGRFSWSAIRSAVDEHGSALPPLLLLLGLATAAGAALLLLRSLTGRHDRAVFPTLAGSLLIVTAAGFLADGLGALQSARVLDGSAELAFDLTAAFPPDTWYGALLTGATGFEPAPTTLQAAVWPLALIPPLALLLIPVGFGRSAAGEKRATDDRADAGEHTAPSGPPGPGGPGDGVGADADGERLCHGARRAGDHPDGDKGRGGEGA